MAMWLIPGMNLANVPRMEFHMIVFVYCVFWAIHEGFVVKYFKLLMPLQDTVIISVVMFRLTGPALIIYFAVMNTFKGYLAYRVLRPGNDIFTKIQGNLGMSTKTERSRTPEDTESLLHHDDIHDANQVEQLNEPIQVTVRPPTQQQQQQQLQALATGPVKPKVPARPMPTRKSVIDAMMISEPAPIVPTVRFLTEPPVLSSFLEPSPVLPSRSEAAPTTGVKPSSLKLKFFTPAS